MGFKLSKKATAQALASADTISANVKKMGGGDFNPLNFIGHQDLSIIDVMEWTDSIIVNFTISDSKARASVFFRGVLGDSADEKSYEAFFKFMAILGYTPTPDGGFNGLGELSDMVGKKLSGLVFIGQDNGSGYTNYSVLERSFSKHGSRSSVEWLRSSYAWHAQGTNRDGEIINHRPFYVNMTTIEGSEEAFISTAYDYEAPKAEAEPAKKAPAKRKPRTKVVTPEISDEEAVDSLVTGDEDFDDDIPF